MHKKLTTYTKKLFGDLHSAIISITVLALLSGSGIVYHFYKNLWLSLIDTIQSPTPLWATIVLVSLLGVYVYIRTSRFHSLSNTSKPKYYKYCPDCDAGISAKKPENYCQCGTKYLEKCPSCSKKIIRDSGCVCSFCGHVFEMSSIPVD